MSDQPEKQNKSSAVYWIFAILLMVFLGFSILVNIGLGFALAIKDPSFSVSDEEAVDEYPTYEEEWSYGSGDVKAVRLQLTGIITRETEGGFFNIPIDRIEELIRNIRAAQHDEDIMAIILEVDTPGGGITPSDEIYNELLNFKNSKEGRKVVIFMRDLAASGGYYVAMAGDWLIAEPTSVVGSIGVIMQTLNWKVLSEKIGISDTTIKSGENKDMLNPFRDSKPEEISMLQEMIDLMHDRFKSIVSSGRGLSEEELETLADGRIFTADQALELDLIDQIGYWDDVVEKTAELLGETSVKVVRYHQPESFWSIFAGIKHPLAAPVSSLQQAPKLQYLWKPY